MYVPVCYAYDLTNWKMTLGHERESFVRGRGRRETLKSVEGLSNPSALETRVSFDFGVFKGSVSCAVCALALVSPNYQLLFLLLPVQQAVCYRYLCVVSSVRAGAHRRKGQLNLRSPCR